MTPREELLAGVGVAKTATEGLAPYDPYLANTFRIIAEWLQLEADQHWHIPYVTEDQVTNKWDLVFKPEWVAMQPCIRMARLINGTEGP